MKSPPFAFEEPTTVGETLDLLNRFGADSKIIAGGQSLVPIMALRLAAFDRLIDVNRVDELAVVRDDASDLVIGATTRQYDILEDPLLAARHPLLAEATALIGHTQIRTRGTVGGSIAHGDPAAEYPAVVLALDAQLEIASTRGYRTVAANDFFTGPYMTDIAEDELLVGVRLPAALPRTGTAIDEITRRHGDFALAGAAAAVITDTAGTITRARVAVFGLGATAMRLGDLETALVGTDGTGLEEATRAAAADLNPPSDVQASAAYRRRIAAPLLERVIQRAYGRSLPPEERA